MPAVGCAYIFFQFDFSGDRTKSTKVATLRHYCDSLLLASRYGNNFCYDI
jgi:hypothetical protein